MIKINTTTNINANIYVSEAENQKERSLRKRICK